MVNLSLYKFWIDNYILNFLNGHPSKYNIAVILMGCKLASIGNSRIVIYEIVEGKIMCGSAIPFPKTFLAPQ